MSRRPLFRRLAAVAAAALTAALIAASPASAAVPSTAMGTKAAHMVHYLYDAPTSASQAADQSRIMGKFGSLGNVPYSWDGGHATTPGPHLGSCSGYTGSIHPCPASHTVGLDCSGFVRWMFKLADGIDLKTGSDSSTNGETSNSHLKKINFSDLKPGDLIFWGALGSTHHVAIYMGRLYVPGQGTGPAIAEERQTGEKMSINLLSWAHSTHGDHFFRVA